MKTFQKAFTALALIALVGLVGCGKTEPAKTGMDTKTKTEAKTEPAKAEPSKTMPEKTDNPMTVDPVTPTEGGTEAQSGSAENKGGVDIPNEGEAAAGSTEKKGGVDVPNE